MGVASIRRDPAFRRFWLGESITFLGGAVRGIALPLTAVLYLDADPVQMGLLVTLQTLPTLFVSMFAGVYVDRVRRRPARARSCSRRCSRRSSRSDSRGRSST